MSEITYSIIIPHYNIPDLLQRALDSIPEREDIEVIVVDDNSDPGMVDFDHFPGLDRPNTHCVFLKKNGGAGVARNTAISQARGKWILCVDADDFLLDGAFDHIDKYRDSDLDVVIFKADSCLSEDVSKKGKRNHASQLCNYIDECISGKREIRNLLFSIMSPWCKLVKKQLLVNNNILFATTPVSEDVIWCAGVAVHCKNPDVSDAYIYCLTEREGSLTSEVNIHKLLIWCDVLKDRRAYLQRYHYEQYDFYFSYDELIALRDQGALTYLRFCIKCLRYGILRPCAMYGIEARLLFKYPYIYLLFGLLNFPKLGNVTYLHKIWRKFI